MRKGLCIAALAMLAGKSRAEDRTWDATEFQFFSHFNTIKLGDEPTRFELGLFDWLVTTQLPQDFYVLGEIVFEPRDTTRFDVDLERIMLTWAPTPAAQLSVGRFHVPLGYWITTFHHGRWLATSIGNPAFVDFEGGGGPFPGHVIGVELSGLVDVGEDVRLGYHAAVANGRGRTADAQIQIQTDSNEAKAFVASLYALFGPVRLGVSGYLDHFPMQADETSPEVDVQEQIAVVDASYVRTPFELLAEGGVVRHDFAGKSAYTTGGYVHFAVQLGALRPYARVDYLEKADTEVYLSHTEDRRGALLGLRVDPTGDVCLKLEGGLVGRSRIDEGDAYAGFQAAWHF